MIFRRDTGLLNSIVTYFKPYAQPLKEQLRILSIGVLAWFLELGVFFWLKGASFEEFSNSFDLITILFFFIYFVEFTFIITNISAFFFWICAKKMGGKGSFLETCTSLQWTTLYTFISFQLFYLITQVKELGLLIHNLSFLGLVASLIYGIVVMSGKISKVHAFNSDRGVNAFLLGALVQAPILFSLILFANTNMRAILILTIPLSMQILITFGVIALAYNAKKKAMF